MCSITGLDARWFGKEIRTSCNRFRGARFQLETRETVA